ncbi:hypothetical protein HPB52_025048 [Rhipicephalus sanguineus]|uniref:Brinker DNA-binding domain-containing protein n=1 Tax=Rhipicephalus sanguineus TaxID=34632 RepID=A0A9D4YRP3_RHISA|nr:hypothetical protein HPB52_025048 [Rhipicephalus sanguineus]
MPAKQKSYMAKFKLTAVKYAEDYGNRGAGRHFDVTEKMIRTWRQSTAKLQAMKSDKKADRGKKSRWAVLEGRLHSWILEQRAQAPDLNDHSSSSDSEEEAEEVPASLPPELAELFQSTLEDEDFGGFEE